LEASDHPARCEGDQEAGAEVEPRDLPAEEAEEKRERDFVDHGRRHKEQERHAERHAGRHEPDEHRDRRTRAERRDDAEERRKDVSARLAPARQEASRLLRSEEAPDDPDDEDDEREEAKDSTAAPKCVPDERPRRRFAMNRETSPLTAYAPAQAASAARCRRSVRGRRPAGEASVAW